MKNFIQAGHVVTVVSPVGGVSSGDPVLIGDALFGVATHDAAAGDPLELVITGVVDIPKDTALQIDQGDRVYWDAGNGWVDKTATSQVCVGIARETQLAAATTIAIILGASGIGDGAA